MESLNLNTLANSLPTSQQNAEKELLNDFKAAAQSITKLYRSSRKTSKRAFNAGYFAACQDLLNFIQQGVSASDVGSGSSQAVDGGGMTIGRVMDWTEARLEAIRATEEEEDEDEEREKERTAAQPTSSRSPAATTTPASPKSTARKLAAPRPKDPVNISTSKIPLELSISSPPTPPAIVIPSISAKLLRPRTAPPQQNITHAPANPPVAFPTSTVATTTVDPPFVIGAGTKRRHAMMMMLESGSSPVSIGHGSGPSSVASSPGGTGVATPSSLGRRRTRSARNLSQLQTQNQNINVIQVTSEPMDVEEDGRERKRVARR